MAIKLVCELCGQIMGTTGIKDIKAFHKKHGDRCQECIKMMNDIDKLFVSAENHAKKEFKQVSQRCKEYVEAETQKLLEKRAAQFEMKLVLEDRHRKERLQQVYDNVEKYTAKEELRPKKEIKDGERNETQDQGV